MSTETYNSQVIAIEAVEKEINHLGVELVELRVDIGGELEELRAKLSERLETLAELGRLALELYALGLANGESILHPDTAERVAQVAKAMRDESPLP